MSSSLNIFLSLRRVCTVLALTLLIHGRSLHGQGLDFSILQPAVERWDADDILEPSGTNVYAPATALGLSGNSNVDAFSYGDEHIVPVSQYFFARVGYSVRRNSLGLGRVVTRQRRGNGVGGDKLQVVVLSYRGNYIPVIGPQLLSDAPWHNLSPLPNETELDGLSARVAGMTNYPIYFSVGPGQSWHPADILIVTNSTSPAQIFATRQQLNLTAGDDIDALAIGTTPGNPPPLQLGPGVVIWVSLTLASPGNAIARRAGGDGVLQVFPGTNQLVLDARSLDLSSGDELDALTGLDPGPATVVHDSALPGMPGQTRQGYTISTSQMLASRFHLHEPVFVTAIGGHMVGTSGSIFGGILRLPGENAWPAGSPFDAGAFLGHVVFEPTSPSEHLRVPLPMLLPAGNYALVFGAGLFGANGAGIMPSNNEDIPGSSSYSSWRGSSWEGTSLRGLRFFMEGITPRLTATLSGTTLTVSWPVPGFILERAEAVTGPFNEVPEALSPYAVELAQPAFFRLKADPSAGRAPAGMHALLTLLEARQFQFPAGSLGNLSRWAEELDGMIRAGSLAAATEILGVLFASLQELPPGNASDFFALDVTFAVEHDLRQLEFTGDVIEVDHFDNMACTGGGVFDCQEAEGSYCRRIRFNGVTVGCGQGKMPQLVEP